VEGRAESARWRGSDKLAAKGLRMEGWISGVVGGGRQSGGGRLEQKGVRIGAGGE
jgi:hypothetical protein